MTRYILIGSGKGGVGKSTVSCNLAVELARQGKSVGLLDADVHGPSQSILFKICEPPAVQGGVMVPFDRHDVKVMTLGAFGRQVGYPWRGPLLRGVLWQMLNATQWNNPDYMLIDLPPGTGEILLFLLEDIPSIYCTIMVTDESRIAQADCERFASVLSEIGLERLITVYNKTEVKCGTCGSTNFLDHCESEQPDRIYVYGDAAVRRAANEGRPAILCMDVDEKYKQCIRDFAHKVMEDYDGRP